MDSDSLTMPYMRLLLILSVNSEIVAKGWALVWMGLSGDIQLHDPPLEVRSDQTKGGHGAPLDRAQFLDPKMVHFKKLSPLVMPKTPNNVRTQIRGLRYDLEKPTSLMLRL